MPIYEYECTACGHAFEALIRKASDVPARCPQCGKARPVKALSTFAVPSAAFKQTAQRCAACPSAGATCASEGSCGCA